MKELHIKEKDFHRSDYKKIIDYPNPYVKEVFIDGELVRINIIPKNSYIEIKNLTKKQQKWFGARDNEVVLFTAVNFHSIPTDLISGTINGRISENHKKSKKYGFINGSGCVGTAGELILKSKIETCINQLKKHGYKVVKLNNEVESTEISKYDNKLIELANNYF